MYVSVTRPRPVSRTLSLNTGAAGHKEDAAKTAKADLRRTASMRKVETKPSVAPSRASKPLAKTGSKGNVKEAAPPVSRIVKEAAPSVSPAQDDSVTFRSRQRKAAPPGPPVPPKPGSNKLDLKQMAAANKPGVSNKAAPVKRESKPAKPSDRANVKAEKPVMRKIVAKNSIAEMAKLAPAPCQENDVRNDQFVSHARATLSPAPARKNR